MPFQGFLVTCPVSKSVSLGWRNWCEEIPAQVWQASRFLLWWQQHVYLCCQHWVATACHQKKIIPSLPPDSIFGNSFTILSKMLFCLMGEGGGTSPGADAQYGKSLSIFQMMHKLYSIMLYHMKLKVLFKQCCTAVGHSALSDWEALYIRCSEQLTELRTPFNPQPVRAMGIRGQFICFYTAVSDYTCKTKCTGFVNCLHIWALCGLSLIWIVFVVSL